MTKAHEFGGNSKYEIPLIFKEKRNITMYNYKNGDEPIQTQEVVSQ